MVQGDDPVPDRKFQDGGEMSEAEIDKNLQDTFPASDPPSWTLGTDHHEAPSVENEKSDKDEPPQH
jgi:hypothetical protein